MEAHIRVAEEPEIAAIWDWGLAINDARTVAHAIGAPLLVGNDLYFDDLVPRWVVRPRSVPNDGFRELGQQLVPTQVSKPGSTEREAVEQVIEG